jgi:prevent-host-death family protein
MNTITATNARSNLFKLLKQTVKGHLHTKISSKEGNAVLISEEDYESLLETAELLAIPGLKESIKRADKDIEKGNLHSLKDVLG